MSKLVTARKPKSQPVVRIKRELSADEVKRVAEKLATALQYDSPHIAMLTLLLDHIDQVFRDDGDVSDVVYIAKKYLLVGLMEFDKAREQFQSNAYANRENILLWPREKRSAS